MINLTFIVGIAVSFVVLNLTQTFEKIGSGPPVVDFAPVVPSAGKGFNSFYGLPQPRQTGSKQSTNWVETEGAGFGTFVFTDLSRLLPPRDGACPGDGTCKEDSQVLIQLRMSQDTVIANKEKAYFQLRFDQSISQIQ